VQGFLVRSQPIFINQKKVIDKAEDIVCIATGYYPAANGLSIEKVNKKATK